MRRNTLYTSATAIILTVAAAVGAVDKITDSRTDETHPSVSEQANSTPPTAIPTATTAPHTLPDTPDSFSTSKRLLYSTIYAGHRTTFYCGCDYSTKRKVDHSSCGYQPRKNARRAGRIEAEHVVPAYWIGHTRPCWREKLCTRDDGKKFKGRSCCEAIDPAFETAHNDLHNLVPAVGEANGDRSNYRFGMIEGELREYGACDFEVDEATRRAEPPEAVRGDIARISFYMEETYGVKLSDAQRKLFSVWDKADPVDAWELERNDRIKAIQGNGNRFVEEAAVVDESPFTSEAEAPSPSQ